MKRFFAICAILLFATTVQATPIDACPTEQVTIQDLYVVKYFNSSTAEVPVEITKTSLTTLVIEYKTTVYVVNNEVLTHIYSKSNSGWLIISKPNLPLYNILREYSHVSFYQETDGTKYLIIERIDGNGSYTMPYIDIIPDLGNNGTIYYNQNEYIIVGEDYAVYTKSENRTYYKFIANN
jgi:hypothetical protein